MQFDVYFVGEFVNEELANLWNGESFSHPSQMSPFYYNKREMANAYKLIAGLQNSRLNETGGELRLVKQSFIYQDSIAEFKPELIPTVEVTVVNDTLEA